MPSDPLETPLPPTFFASAPRASEDALRDAITRTASSPMVTELLRAFGSIVAVLNRERQVLAVNEDLMRFLGIEEPSSLLGFRPGEIFGCVHAEDHPGGCGTSRFCATCGAAMAIVLSQETHTPQDRECLMTVRDGQGEQAMEFRVRSVPISIDGHELYLLLLSDIREQKRQEALSHTFLHDLRNTLTGLMSVSELLALEAADGRNANMARLVTAITQQIADELRAHEILERAEKGSYEVQTERVRLSEILDKVETAFYASREHCPGCLTVEPPTPDATLAIDPILVHRVLVNMVKNALEATGGNGPVRLWCEAKATQAVWQVHNPGAIPEETKMRIFQRYFSTKGQQGRGLGTYSMKLLGEGYLGGTVRFVSSEKGGTIFTFRLPLQPQT